MSAWIIVDLSDPDNAIVKGRQGGALARDAGAHPIYVGTVRGWLIDHRHTTDLLALLQHRGVRHRVIEPRQREGAAG